jgi:hypothetical protein
MRDLIKEIEAYCRNVLDEKYPDWTSVDGSDGGFTFNVESGAIDWRHSINEMISHDFAFKI